ADDELDLVIGGQLADVAPQVAVHFRRTGRLDVEYLRYPPIHRRDVDRAGGLQRHLVASVAQALQQTDTALLRKRLATGDADVAHTVARDFGQHGIHVPPLAAVERVGGIAVLATQRAA